MTSSFDSLRFGPVRLAIAIACMRRRRSILHRAKRAFLNIFMLEPLRISASVGRKCTRRTVVKAYMSNLEQLSNRTPHTHTHTQDAGIPYWINQSEQNN